MRNFVERQRKIARSALLYVGKHQNPLQVEKSRTIIRQCGRLVERLASLLSATEHLEITLQHKRAWHTACQQKLHQLYDLALTVALVDGLLQQKTLATTILGELPAC